MYNSGTMAYLVVNYIYNTNEGMEELWSLEQYTQIFEFALKLIVWNDV